jgi:hypothetical protein
MASSPTTRNRFNKQGTGDNSGTWGTTLNEQSLDLVDTALDGFVSVAVAGNVTLSSTNYVDDEARNRVLKLTGAGGFNVVIPGVEKWYLVHNACTAAVVVKTSGGTGATINPATITPVYCDGTDCAQATSLWPLANGTVAAPALYFSSDTDTGIYRIGANNIGVAANGAKVLDVGTAGLGVTGTGTFSAGVTATTGTFSGAVSMAALTATTGAFSGTTIGLANNTVISYGGGGVTITHNSAGDTLAFAGAVSYSFDASLLLSNNTLIGWGGGGVTITHNSAGDSLTFAGAVGGYAFDSTLAATALTATTGAISSTLSVTGVATLAAGTATPAGGGLAARLLLGTTAGFGIYYGSGAPSVTAAKGSLYLRSDGSSGTNRLYVNTNGATTWSAITTAD